MRQSLVNYLTRVLLTLIVAGCGEPPASPKDTAMPDTPSTQDTHTAIDWHDWSEETLALAREQDKLILLDSGATWCHWCHVMDRVTYEDSEVVELVAERFIPVRIDRDRRPELDAWLQRTPTVIRGSGQGGWPLTVILTPEAVPLWKATFLPPRAAGKFGPVPGLVDVLQQLDTIWREDNEKLRQATATFREKGPGQVDEAFQQPGELNDDIVQKIVAGIKADYDETQGGFGGAPKFFGATSLELLLTRAWAGEEEAGRMVAYSLSAIANGGVHDHIGGGFHRYSVDARWHVPHFEKMAYDNAALLELYAAAYAHTGEQRFADVARDIVAWVQRDLAAQEGFYASQDADVGLNDDGDFFTWTPEEIRQAVGDDADVVIAFYGIDDQGDMHNRPGRNVLHISLAPEELAAETEHSAAEVREILARANAALLQAREQRPTPSVDQTIFANLNGMMISAWLRAAEQLGEPTWTDEALEKLNALLASHRNNIGVFAHYVEDGQLRNVGLLADQAWMLRALLDAFQHHKDEAHLRAARQVGDFIIDRLVGQDGAFISRPASEPGSATGLAPRRSWEDAPSRSPASVAAAALADLGYLTGEDVYTEAAQAALASFAGGVQKDYGTFLGGYALAVDRLLHGPRSVVMVGQAVPADLQAEARRTYLPHKLVLTLHPADAGDKAVLDRLGYAPVPGGVVAYVCEGKMCLAPADDVETLRDRLSELRQR